MDNASVVEDLEAQARAAGKSISEVCREAGVARSTFTRWKSGDNAPNIRTLRKIQEVLNHNGGPRQPEPEPEAREAEAPTPERIAS